MAITVTRYEQNHEAFLLERLMQRPYPSATNTGKAGVVRTLQPFVFDGTGTPSREQPSTQRRSTEKASNIPLKDRARPGAAKKVAAPEAQDRAATPPGSRTAQRKAVHQLASSPPKIAQGVATPHTKKAAPTTPATTTPMKALQAQVLNNWAGPGFSLPPAPEQLPMPSASLLTPKRQ